VKLRMRGEIFPALNFGGNSVSAWEWRPRLVAPLSFEKAKVPPSHMEYIEQSKIESQPNDCYKENLIENPTSSNSTTRANNALYPPFDSFWGFSDFSNGTQLLLVMEFREQSREGGADQIITGTKGAGHEARRLGGVGSQLRPARNSERENAL
jgi:hypothetical protein